MRSVGRYQVVHDFMWGWCYQDTAATKRHYDILGAGAVHAALGPEGVERFFGNDLTEDEITEIWETVTAWQQAQPPRVIKPPRFERIVTRRFAAEDRLPVDLRALFGAEAAPPEEL
jgi:hypothetical protein